MNYKQLFYDFYFKLTDVKFWFDCLDDKEKLFYITILCFIPCILYLLYLCC